MEIIIKPPCTGKTTELIKKSAETWTYIVTADRNRADHVAKMAKDMGIDIPHPIGFNDFLECRMRTPVKEVLIDDADDCLRYLFGRVNISAITMRGEP